MEFDNYTSRQSGIRQYYGPIRWNSTITYTNWQSGIQQYFQQFGKMEFDNVTSI
jgi:hypothetical protein